MKRWTPLPALAIVVLAGSTWAADDFDHAQTGFPLTGSHDRVACESCHVRGVLAGTPTDCGACHESSGLRATTSKPTSHVPTSNRCDDCHTTASWISVRFDHGMVEQECRVCHNGVTAEGKPLSHPQTSDRCQDCHSTLTWLDARFNHSGISTGCFSCHNGVAATGKPPGHIASSNECETCHSTVTWSGARFDHAGITGGCATCHNGTTATGKPRDHVPTTSSCEVCHSTRAWVPASAFDHTRIVSGCTECHNGTTATGKPRDHIPTTAGCETCHSTSAWTPASFDHAGVTSGCETCHNGVTATGKPSGHFVTSRGCETCHTTDRWSPDIFRHTSPAYPGEHRRSLGCNDCHQGGVESAAWTHPGYRPDCAGCHANDFEPGPHRKTTNPETRYTVSELRDCTGACHVYTDSTLTTIDRRRSGPEHRITDGEF